MRSKGSFTALSSSVAINHFTSFSSSVLEVSFLFVTLLSQFFLILLSLYFSLKVFVFLWILLGLFVGLIFRAHVINLAITTCTMKFEYALEYVFDLNFQIFFLILKYFFQNIFYNTILDLFFKKY